MSLVTIVFIEGRLGFIYIYIYINVHPFSEPDFTWEIAMILRAGSMILFTKFGC